MEESDKAEELHHDDYFEAKLQLSSNSLSSYLPIKEQCFSQWDKLRIAMQRYTSFKNTCSV